MALLPGVGGRGEIHFNKEPMPGSLSPLQMLCTKSGLSRDLRNLRLRSRIQKTFHFHDIQNFEMEIFLDRLTNQVSAPLRNFVAPCLSLRLEYLAGHAHEHCNRANVWPF